MPRKLLEVRNPLRLVIRKQWVILNLLGIQLHILMVNSLGNRRLQKWTRGAFAIVNSGGHICYWAPLFKSEGPAQVAVIVLTFLILVLGPLVPFEEWKNIGKNLE